MAITHYKKSIDILENIPDKSNMDLYNLGLNYTNLGEVYRQRKDFNKALHYHDKARKLIESNEKSRSEDIGLILNNIALSYTNKEEYEKAEEFYFKAIKLIDDNHPQKATFYYNLGRNYTKKGENNNAEEFIIKALDLLIKLNLKYTKEEDPKQYTKLYKNALEALKDLNSNLAKKYE